MLSFLCSASKAQSLLLARNRSPRSSARSRMGGSTGADASLDVLLLPLSAALGSAGRIACGSLWFEGFVLVSFWLIFFLGFVFACARIPRCSNCLSLKEEFFESIVMNGGEWCLFLRFTSSGMWFRFSGWYLLSTPFGARSFVPEIVTWLVCEKSCHYSDFFFVSGVLSTCYCVSRDKSWKLPICIILVDMWYLKSITWLLGVIETKRDACRKDWVIFAC